MTRLFVRHGVADYAKWRKAYDEFDAERRGMGVIGAAVYRVAGNDKDVVVTHDFESTDKAKAFIESPRLREVMTTAGVSGQPTAWIASQA
jgi:hypothetical protein